MKCGTFVFRFTTIQTISRSANEVMCEELRSLLIPNSHYPLCEPLMSQENRCASASTLSLLYSTLFISFILHCRNESLSIIASVGALGGSKVEQRLSTPTESASLARICQNAFPHWNWLQSVAIGFTASL